MNTQRHAYDICICLYIHVDILFDKLPCMRKISFKAHAECSTYILSNVQRITDSVDYYYSPEMVPNINYELKLLLIFYSFKFLMNYFYVIVRYIY